MVESTHILIVVAFIIGAVFSAFAGNMGMKIATKTNVRTTQAAKTSLPNALKVSFGGGTALSNAAMEANVEALKLDDAAKEALMAEFQSYSAMYAYNHSDQIRQSNGLEELSFEAEDLDWSTQKVVVVSTYNTKWGKNRDFFEGVKNGSLKTLKESGHAVAAYASRHFYGSGAGWHTYQFYNTWSDFAAYEEANLGGPMDEDAKKFWSSIESHTDEILTFIGGINPETKVFSYSK